MSLGASCAAGLIEARRHFAEGEIPAPEFKRVEDGTVVWAISLQERAGLPVVTDGEMRRESFQSQMVEAVEDFGEHTIDAYLWGEWHGNEAVGDAKIERPPKLGVVGKLRRRRFLSVEEFVYARALTDRTIKVTLPSPSLYANFWAPELSKEAYPTLGEFLVDVAEILCEEVEGLVRLGATHIQLDAPHYPLLLDPKTREFYEGRGWNFDHWMSRGIDLDNHVIGDHPSVTFAFHLCRGNQGSRSRDGFRTYPRREADARVRRRTLWWFRAPRACAGGQDRRPRPCDDENPAALDPRVARGPPPRSLRCRPARAAGLESAVRVRHIRHRQRHNRRGRGVQAPHYRRDCRTDLGLAARRLADRDRRPKKLLSWAPNVSQQDLGPDGKLPKKPV
jgi:methionine synthase II (cobalamin-independent)